MTYISLVTAMPCHRLVTGVNQYVTSRTIRNTPRIRALLHGDRSRGVEEGEGGLQEAGNLVLDKNACVGYTSWIMNLLTLLTYLIQSG